MTEHAVVRGSPDPAPEAIFLAALDRATAQERAAYVEGACAGRPRLLDRVRELLRCHEKSRGPLDVPPPGLGRTVEAPPGERPGTQIGPYKLLQQIGEGGMGTVFMAEQQQPVQRKVALKLIRPGMDSRQVVARFEAERQALALMDHPNIARVLDAGTTESGRPYFVMELVKGVPITKYCDEHRLTPRQRLELFVPVCQAVQHAHTKGIIHRDLKPSNVLIALYDGKPVPKVIDFGVAKAVGQKLTEKTLFTEFGAVVGTLEYMSPEQAELNQLDIDTRSDVYSLGVLLYQLLTDTTPLLSARLKESGLLEALRLIREEEPPRPSTRLSTSKELAAIAANRGSEPARLSGLVKGELDWIVMKCLEKDRDRRYDTANSLAQDLLRYLHDEPVQACPPSTAYRLQKLVRRYKRALVMAGVVLTGLVLAVVGLAVSTVLTWQAKSEVEEALAREKRSGYFQRVALAEREWSANNLARAEELLGLCPPEFRGWEWHYLKRLRGKTLPPLRHDNAVTTCAISPDGREIVSAELNGVIRIWDAETAKELDTLGQPHERPCTFLVFSTDGKRLASDDYDGVKIWDMKTRQVEKTWKAPGGTLQGLACGSDGRLLACCCRPVDGREEGRIYDLLTGEERFALPDHGDIVMDIAVSPDGKLLASASLDGTVRTWDMKTGEGRRTLRGNTGFWCVRFSPDGLRIAAGNGTEGERGVGEVKIWEARTGRELVTLPGHGAKRIAFSPDGQRMATGGIDQTVKLWDTASGQEILTLRGHGDWVQGLAFSPDGQRLVTSSWDRTVRIWDARPWQEGENTGDEVVTLRGHTDSVNALAFHPTQARLATAGSDGTVRTWDTQNGKSLHTFRVGLQKAKAVAFSPDGRRLAVGGNPGRVVTVRDSATGEELLRLGGHEEPVVSLAFSPDGKHLASGGLDAFVLIWDTRAPGTGSWKVIHRLPIPGWGIVALAFSPAAGSGDPRTTGRLLAAACNDGAVRLWDMTEGREVTRSPLRHQGPVYGLAFSSDGRLLVSSGGDRTIRLWEVATGKQVQEVLDASAGATQGIAFSADGRFVAWGGNDATVKVWQRETGAVQVRRGHGNWVRCVGFSPDGKVLASGSQDGTIKLWPVP